MASQLPQASIDVIPAELLAHIPGCGSGRPPREVAVLTGGGRHNRCLVVTTDEGRFVLRWRVERGERPGAAGSQELRCHLAAASLGIAPGIVAAAPDGQWMLMDYLDAPPWHTADLHEPARLEALGLRLAQLHEMSPPGVGSLAVMPIVDGQAALILARDPAAAAQVAALQDRARALTARIADFSVRTVLNHGDLAASNFLGPQPMMVDWEYAQRADPVYDLACLLSYYPTLEPQLDRLLGASGLADAASRERLGVYRALFEVFNVLWREAQAESHGDPAGIVTRPPAE
jgi:aminoglycoside phosphotransferase (APT) family kinase protein